MTSSADLFTLALLSTGGLYVSMLAYFNGLVGTKRPNTQIMWNSESINWTIMLLIMVSVIFRIVGPLAATAGPGIWFLIGVGILLVVYIYLILKLARHDLPAWAFWCIAALTVIAIIYVFANLVLIITSVGLNLALYAEELEMLLVLMSLILILLLLFKLIRCLWNSFVQNWLTKPDTPERLIAGGITVTPMGRVTNPNGALSEINLEPGAKSEAEGATVHPDSCIIVDFGIRRIEDHGFRGDLRIIHARADQPITIEVSNDYQSWFMCFQDDNILTDWDVPFYDSPWRYVRICNQGEQPIQITEVYDLD
jgi:hypothetical protein